MTPPKTLRGDSSENLKAQDGVVLIVTLITLVVLMISSMALIRSFETTLTMAGNLAFKRDLVNHAERGLAQAMQLVDGGTLGTANIAGSNYSASMLASSSNGLPLALVNDITFAASFSGADISDPTNGVTIRYIVDRLCNAAGTVDLQRACSFVNVGTDDKPNYQPVYRISVRATGPRNTRAFVQATVTR